jgi:tetratricopeptide (TPR) repeat protein
VPNRHVRDFVGRESVLAQIDTSLNSESEIGTRIVVLRAMGGQGKTQIALEYCRRTRHKAGTAIFWVDASSENTLKQSYSTISEILASQADMLPDIDMRVNFTLRKLKAWRGPWLIVLDNYDNPVDFNNLEDFIPEYEQGMVLVTSRHADADGLAKEENQIQLPGLLESEAVELLLSQGKGRQTDDVTSRYAKLIVKRLGYHPLAIAQAGAYIKTRKLPLEEFLDHFQRRKAIILKETTPQMSQYRRKLGGAERETSLSVFTTWELSYQQLLAEDTDDKCMADLLTLLAFFAAGGVSERLFQAYCDHSEASGNPCSDPGAPKSPHDGQEPYGMQEVGDRQKHSVPGAFLPLNEETWDSDLYCDALSTMAQLSLVEGFAKAPDGMYKATLHPLVRDWIRLRTEWTACVEYTYLAATCMHSLIRSGTKNDYFTMAFSIGQDLIKHLDANMINMENFFPQAPHVLGESKRINLYEYCLDFRQLYDQFGEYAKAAEVLRQCLARRNNGIATNDPLTRRLLARLGDSLKAMGEYKETEEVITKALHMVLEADVEKNEETLDYLATLSGLLLAQDLNEEAEEYVRESLRLCEKLSGKEDLLTLRCMSNLGELLNSQEKFTEAEEVFRQTMKLQEVVLGKEHPNTLTTMHNLASILNWPEDKEEKEDLYRQILDIEERMRGKEHPQRMMTLTNLAGLMAWNGQYDVAEQMYLQSMKSLELSLGKNHKCTMDCCESYGLLLRRTGRYEEALRLLGRAYRGYCERLGPQNRDTLNCGKLLNGLMVDMDKRIRNLVDAGQKIGAEETYILAINSLAASLGENHHTTLRSMSNYGVSLHKAGLYVEALPLFEEAYTRTLESLGPEHADTIRRKQWLKHLLDDMKKSIKNMVAIGEYNEAEDMYVRCMNSMEASLGKSGRFILRFTTDYGSFLGKAGRYQDALLLLERAYTGFRESCGPRHPSTIYRERLLNEVLEHMKKDTNGVYHSEGNGARGDEFV